MRKTVRRRRGVRKSRRRKKRWRTTTILSWIHLPRHHSSLRRKTNTSPCPHPTRAALGRHLVDGGPLGFPLASQEGKTLQTAVDKVFGCAYDKYPKSHLQKVCMRRRIKGILTCKSKVNPANTMTREDARQRRENHLVDDLDAMIEVEFVDIYAACTCSNITDKHVDAQQYVRT